MPNTFCGRNGISNTVQISKMFDCLAWKEQIVEY